MMDDYGSKKVLGLILQQEQPPPSPPQKIPLKFRLTGIRHGFCLISLPPAGAQLSVFPSRAQTACSTVTLYFVFWPETLRAAVHTVLRGVSPHNPRSGPNVCTGTVAMATAGLTESRRGGWLGCRGRSGGRAEGLVEGTAGAAATTSKEPHLIHLEKN